MDTLADMTTDIPESMKKTAFLITGTPKSMEKTDFRITGIPESMEKQVYFPAPEGAQVAQQPPKSVVIPKAPVDTTTFEYKVKLFAMPLEKRNAILDSVGISRDAPFWIDTLVEYSARHGKDFLN